jgi:hypothetical protein
MRAQVQAANGRVWLYSRAIGSFCSVLSWQLSPDDGCKVTFQLLSEKARMRTARREEEQLTCSRHWHRDQVDGS